MATSGATCGISPPPRRSATPSATAPSTPSVGSASAIAASGTASPSTNARTSVATGLGRLEAAQRFLHAVPPGHGLATAVGRARLLIARGRPADAVQVIDAGLASLSALFVQHGAEELFDELLVQPRPGQAPQWLRAGGVAHSDSPRDSGALMLPGSD